MVRHLFRKKGIEAASKELKVRDKKLENAKVTARSFHQRAKKVSRPRLKNRQILRRYLDRAGFEGVDESKIYKNMFRIIIVLCLLFSVVSLIVASVMKSGFKGPLTLLLGIWTAVFAGLFLLAWVILYVFLDLKVFSRTKAVEEVLPDFLQLASANISAGMPIDRALWFAVRPRFGILAKEIEEVAKSTYSGEDLADALRVFADKFDSLILKRSINLLIEGMDAGGEMGDLLNKIAINIQETRLLKQEMAANVMTYAIFIGFATMVAAPILYGLSSQLLSIIQRIMSVMAQASPSGGASSGLFSLNVSGSSLSQGDFQIFTVLTLFVTSLFSGFIISIIRKGSIKEGARFIPAMVLGTMALYALASWILGALLGGLVQI